MKVPSTMGGGGAGAEALHPAAAEAAPAPASLVARNMLAPVFSQFVATPVSIVVNAVLARSSVVVAEVAMVAAVGFALRAFPFAALPFSVATYAGVLWAVGGIDPEILHLLRDVFRRKRPPGRVAQVGTLA